MRKSMLGESITVSDLEIMSQANHYRAWMYRNIAPFIGQRILEVGAGIGNFTACLLDRECIVAIDTYAPCIEHITARFGHEPKVVAVQLDIADADAHALRRYEFDTVICLNVLEHIPDDLQALAVMYAALKPGGCLILLVPAFPFLYGSVDRSLGHCRRYTKKTLLPKIRQTGFQVQRAFYMNMIGVAGWFLNNRILMWHEESAVQIGFFDRFIVPWAERIEGFLRPPIGLSLIAICRKA